MPNRRAACAHWYFRCSVGVTTVTAATSRRASSSAATVRAYVVFPAPGVATSRKSRLGTWKYAWYAAFCHSLRGCRSSFRTGSWCVLTRAKGYRNSGPAGGPERHRSAVAALAARRQVLVNLLAHGADRIALRVTAGDPDLAAQR